MPTMVEFLDASSVLSPVFDIIGVLVTLNLGVALELENIVCDSLQLILECLGISWDLVNLGQKVLLSLGIGLEDLKLGSNVFLEVHCSGNSVFWEHGTRCLLDVLELSSSSILPGIKSLKRVVKSSKGSNKLLNLSNSALESSNNFQLILNSLDFLAHALLLVLWDGNAHGLVVVID